MELLQLKYFCEAVNSGSLSAVARQHMVPPSSVSHTIARLESELGCELFSRTGNKILLNDYGHAFYESISDAIEKIETAKSTVREMREQTVSLVLSQGGYSVVPMLTAFRRAHPGIKLKFPLKSLEHSGGFFIRITAMPFEDEEEYESVSLFDDEILIAVCSDDPLAEKAALTFEDIKDSPVIWFHNSPESKDILNYYKAHGAKPNIMLECSKEAFAAELVKNGFGIAFYPKSAHPIEKNEGVRTCTLTDLHLVRKIYASYPRRFSPSDSAQTFLAFAKEYFNSKI